MNNIDHDVNRDINPFTGMSNIKSMQLQQSWENKMSNENKSVIAFDINTIDYKLKKSNLTLISSEFEIDYHQMCPTSIHFSFDVKV